MSDHLVPQVEDLVAKYDALVEQLSSVRYRNAITATGDEDSFTELTATQSALEAVVEDLRLILDGQQASTKIPGVKTLPSCSSISAEMLFSCGFDNGHKLIPVKLPGEQVSFFDHATSDQRVGWNV